jgi:hypothetical protein
MRIDLPIRAVLNGTENSGRVYMMICNILPYFLKKGTRCVETKKFFIYYSLESVQEQKPMSHRTFSLSDHSKPRLFLRP